MAFTEKKNSSLPDSVKNWKRNKRKPKVAAYCHEPTSSDTCSGTSLAAHPLWTQNKMTRPLLNISDKSWGEKEASMLLVLIVPRLSFSTNINVFSSSICLYLTYRLECLEKIQVCLANGYLHINLKPLKSNYISRLIFQYNSHSPSVR